MQCIKIAIKGDTANLEQALKEACEAVDRVHDATVYRAWIEPAEYQPGGPPLSARPLGGSDARAR